MTRRETGTGAHLAGCAETDDQDAVLIAASPIAPSQVVPVAVCCCAFHGEATGNGTDEKMNVGRIAEVDLIGPNARAAPMDGHDCDVRLRFHLPMDRAEPCEPF